MEHSALIEYLKKNVQCEAAILLASDSYVLFQNSGTITSLLQKTKVNNFTGISYLGFSNGNEPEFYNIFCSMVEGWEIGSYEVRHIQPDQSSTDPEFLSQSNIICLAGGDPMKGWKMIKQHGIDEILKNKIHDRSCVMLGISAGAVQLGTYIYTGGIAIAAGNIKQKSVIPGLKAVSLMVAAHDEDNDWKTLQTTLTKEHLQGENGLGIPFGSALWLSQEHTQWIGNQPVVF